MNPYLTALAPYKWLAFALLLAGTAALLYIMGYNSAADEYELAISNGKIEAGRLLQSETDRVRTVESKLAEAKNNQELKDAEHKEIVTGLAAQLRARAGALGQLRDPNAIRCGAGSGSASGPAPATASDRPDDATQTDGLLSAELTGLLFRLQAEADDINNAYGSCRGDTFSVRGLQPH